MRVALVIGRYHAHGGGAERWTDRHVRYLLERGIDVHLISRSFVGAPTGAVCHPVKVSRGSGARLRFADAIEKTIRRERFDVVHDMGEGWHADFFMPHHGTRAAGLEQNVRLLPAWQRPLQRLIHRTLPRYREFLELESRQYAPDSRMKFVALSRMVRADMKRFYQVPDDRLELVYNGVDVQRFQPGRDIQRRQASGWQDRVIFLLVAHNFRLKGLATAIEALADLSRTDRKVGLLVLGSDRRGPYRRLARRLGVADHVRFLGNQKDPVPWYQMADVYVQPTFYDPCSLVVLEALACGLPVITTPTNGAGELIEPGREGHLIGDARDVHGLRRAMEGYLDPQVRADAGRQARQLALRNSLDANSGRFLYLYRRRLGLEQAA